MERRHADGSRSQKSLKDAESTSSYGLMPDVVFEVVPEGEGGDQ